MSSFGQALDRLSAAQKSKRGVSIYSRFVNRPIGRVLAAACFVLRMTPNQVTLGSAVATVLGLTLLVTATPTPASGLGVALLLMLGFALDSADGQLARLTGLRSPAGEWLDHVVDAGKIVAVHSAVLIAVFRSTDAADGWYLVPLAFQVVGIVTFVGGLLVELLRRSPAAVDQERSPSTLRAVGLLPADYGILAASFVLWGWPTLFLTGYGLLFAANLVIMVLLLNRWFRALREVSHCPPTPEAEVPRTPSA